MITDYDRLLLEVALKRGLLSDIDALEAHLFGKQKKFVADKSKFKVGQCSRRAGKSETAACLLYTAASKHPNSTALYVALTRSSAKNIMWPKLLRIADQYKIKCEPVESSLEIKMGNGSRIWLVGADMQNFIERLRGGAYSIGVLDEVQSHRSHVQNLVDDILTPATADFDGSICMFGTPGPVPRGYFYDATNGKQGFSVHKWSMLDNPHMPNAEKFMRELLERKGWTTDNPTFRREYLNEWVLDTDALFYKIKDKNIIPVQEFRGPEWSRVIGVDYGWNDKTAFAVLCYSKYDRKIYVEHSEAHGQMIPSNIAGRLSQLIQTYKPDKIVADTGGLGKSITEEMIRRYSIAVEPASKTDKFTWVSLMNGDLIDGNLLILDRNEDLIHQLQTLQKDDKDPTKEDPAMPNDQCLVGETLVETINGPVKIKDIKIGDLVLTRNGYRRVLASQMTNPEASVVELSFSNGAKLICTPNHPIFSDGSFVGADALLYGNRVWSLNNTASNGEYSQTQNNHHIETIFSVIKKAKQFICIGLFGKCLTDPYQRVFKYIIKTATHTITRLKTLSALAQKSTYQSILQNKEPKPLDVCVIALGHLLKFGTNPKPESIGTKNTLKNLTLVKMARKLRLIALCVARKLQRLSTKLINIAQLSVLQNGVVNQVWTILKKLVVTAKKPFQSANLQNKNIAQDVVLISKTQSSTKKPVYNLTIEDSHEFFANGILTHNCDSLLYAFRFIRSYHVEAKPIEEEEDEIWIQEQRRFKQEKQKEWWET